MVKVWVIQRTGRKYFECQWIDPETGLKRTRSTKQSRRREAERFAVKLEQDLNNPADEIEQVTWKVFVELYKKSCFPGKSEKTKLTTTATLNLVQRVLKPARPSVIDTRKVTQLANYVRAQGRSEFTVRRHLGEVRKLLSWARRNGFMSTTPNIEMPRKLSGAKARAVTPEEFDRLLIAVPKVVGDKRAASWEFLLRGLWWSGLRLTESLSLHWTDSKDLMVDLSGKYPMFQIQAHAEKGRKFRHLPMAPEFAELLQTVPEQQRKGLVFRPQACNGERPLEDWTSKVISKIGKQAGVKVGVSEGQEKYASAHDLRRAFGIRWASRVKSSVLKEMMRHESITTTEKYYLLQEAESTAAQIHQSMPKIEQVANSGNT